MDFNTLKKWIQIYWSQIIFFLKLIILSYLTLTFKLYLKLHIPLIYFLIETKFGYSFYFFLILYGFFSCNGINCHAANTFAAFFVLYIIQSAFELLMLFKIPFTRKILEDLLTKKYILSYFNEYTLTRIFFKTVGLFIGAVFIDVSTEYLDHLQNQVNAKKIMDDYHTSLKIAGLQHDFDSDAYKNAIREAYSNLHRKPVGLISKSINNEIIKHFCSWLLKIIGR